MATWTPVALSALHHRHVGLGAAMVESDGWQRPARYTAPEDELNQLRNAVGICDISPVGKVLLQGEAIEPLLNTAFGEVGGLDIGRLRISHLRSDPNDQGALLARLAADEVLVLTTPNRSPSVSDALSAEPGQCGHAVDLTSALAGLKIAGPLAHRLLAGVTEVDTDPVAFADMSCAQAKVAEIHGTLLRRDAGALLSYELYFGREFGEYMWDALVEAGEEYGVAPFGIEALKLLGSGG